MTRPRSRTTEISLSHCEKITSEAWPQDKRAHEDTPGISLLFTFCIASAFVVHPIQSDWYFQTSTYFPDRGAVPIFPSLAPSPCAIMPYPFHIHHARDKSSIAHTRKTPCAILISPSVLPPLRDQDVQKSKNAITNPSHSFCPCLIPLTRIQLDDPMCLLDRFHPLLPCHFHLSLRGDPPPRFLFHR